MSEATFLVGDVFKRMAELPDGSFDLIITSPPFLALRSYLPDGHPDKALEIGSEATPAEFLDTMLALTAEWGRLLAPHGSIAIEIGDTYSGSGGAGGDYSPGGLRDGQAMFDGSAAKARRQNGDYPNRDDYPRPARNRTRNPDEAWPPAKSLAMIPELYAASIAYGRNLLTGADSPAGHWRIRNVKPWIRSNPPVGALGDKERPATSYITVATRAVDRYFDLDAVRTGSLDGGEGQHRSRGARGGGQPIPGGGGDEGGFGISVTGQLGGCAAARLVAPGRRHPRRRTRHPRRQALSEPAHRHRGRQAGQRHPRPDNVTATGPPCRSATRTEAAPSAPVACTYAEPWNGQASCARSTPSTCPPGATRAPTTPSGPPSWCGSSWTRCARDGCARPAGSPHDG